MSKVAIQGNASGTGVLTVAAPNTNSDYTLTLPAETGTVLTSASTIIQNAGPAFSAYSTSGQSITAGSTALLTFQAEHFDTDNCFDTSTYRFTPTVAGYYQFSTGVAFQARETTEAILNLYKNGGSSLILSDNYGSWGINGCGILYLNGTTDYVELRLYLSNNNTLHSGSALKYFSGCLVRAA